MGRNDKARWIVLVNKSPKGPLTEGEIRALLAENIVKINDIAFQVGEESSQSDWRFLWQFQEFDRRTNESDDEKEAAARDYKRTPVDPKTLKEKVTSVLPPEIASIRPEDLIIQVQNGNRGVILEQVDEDEPLPSGMKPSDWSMNRSTFINLGVAFCLLTFVVYQIVGTDGSAPKVEANRAITEESNQPKPREAIALPLAPERKPSSPLITGKQTLNTKTSAPAVPSARDSGEIALDEYQRKREERWDRDRKEEEERRKAEMKMEQELEEEEMDLPRKKKKSKKRKAAAVVEDEAFEPSDDEVTSNSGSESASESDESED